MQNTEVVSVRLPTAIRSKLAGAAKRLDRSQNWLINQAIEDYLNVYEEQKREIENAIAEADAGGKFYSATEVDKRLERFLK